MGFDSEPDRTWPELYLLHGAWDDYTSWTRETDVADLTADTDLLVVMPEAGESGWYPDWWNFGKGGPPAWEVAAAGIRLSSSPSIRARSHRSAFSRAAIASGRGGAPIPPEA